jgi:hypothetical protein
MAFAATLMQRLSEFLEAPKDNIVYVDILPNLKFGQRQASVWLSAPTMTHGSDGFWYFGVEFFFQVPDSVNYGRQLSLFGLKKQGDLFVLRHGKDSQIHRNDNKAIQDFCESMYADIKAFYEGPVGEPPRRIGFVLAE